MLMSMALLSVMFILCFAYFFWHIYYPYSKFHNYECISTQIIKSVSRSGYQDKPLGSYIFQRGIQLCEKHREDEMCVLWTVEPFLFVFGENIVKVLANDPSLTDKPRVYDAFKFSVGNGIFTSNGDVWKKQLKLMSPALSTRLLKDAVPVMNDYALSLVRELADFEGNVTTDTKKLLVTYALKIFAGSTLGIKVDSKENEKRMKRMMDMYPELYESTINRVFKPWLRLKLFAAFSSEVKKSLLLNKELETILTKILEEMKDDVLTRNSTEKADEDPCLKLKTLGEVLIEEHLKDPSFTMKDLMFQMKTLMAGGTDTIAQTLVFIFWLLGHHQDIQDQVYEEISSSIEGESVQFEDLKKLSKLENVIKETLRLYPVVPIYARLLKKDVPFGKHIIPKGTSVVFFPYVLHRNPEIYPDPESFMPERFAVRNANIKPSTYTPFAEGTRYCLGKIFAMLELKIVMVHVLRNFKIISMDKKEDVCFNWEMTLKSVQSLGMKYIPRNL